MNSPIIEITGLREVNKAMMALRSYGLSSAKAEEILRNEVSLAIQEYGVVPMLAVSPRLVEDFGLQHLEEATSMVYYFMETYNLQQDDLLEVLDTMQMVFRPEELVTNPELVRLFLKHLRERFEEQDMYEKKTISQLLSGLTEEDIERLVQSDFDRED